MLGVVVLGGGRVCVQENSWETAVVVIKKIYGGVERVVPVGALNFE